MFRRNRQKVHVNEASVDWDCKFSYACVREEEGAWIQKYLESS